MKVATNQTEAITMINVQTNIVKNIPVPIKTIMHKFSLVNNETYDFGMVEVDTERRGNIEIHNPSEKPIEVSFHIAPSNYLEMIFQELMSDESLIKWMVLCEKFTFFDPHGRKMCQEFLSINVLSDERLSQVTYFFFKNYFNFINNNEIGEELFINFISEQKEILKGSIKNITDSTQATKPEAKEKCPGGCDNQNMLVSFFNKLNPFSKTVDITNNSIPKIDPAKGEQYEEFVESIKVRLNQWIDEYPQNLSDEFKTLLNTQKQNFFIENPSS